jgi:hypothetical protein
MFHNFRVYKNPQQDASILKELIGSEVQISSETRKTKVREYLAEITKRYIFPIGRYEFSRIPTLIRSRGSNTYITSLEISYTANIIVQFMRDRVILELKLATLAAECAK